MIHDRNTGSTVMTKTEKVKTFFEPYTPHFLPHRHFLNETLERKKTYLIKALREKYVVECVCVCELLGPREG